MSEQLGLFGEPADQEPAKTTKRKTESRIQYFDLETQKSADEVGGWEIGRASGSLGQY